VPEIDDLKRDAKVMAIAARSQPDCVRLALAGLEPPLPPERVLRVHRQAIVTVDHAQAMKPDAQRQLEILMRDGSTLLATRDAPRRLHDRAI
jgi:two-component system, LytTR family, response regulator